MVSIKKCKSDIKQLAVFCAAFERIQPGDLTDSLLEIKKTELDRRWSKIIKTYEDYIGGEEKGKEKVKEEEEPQDEVSTE